MPFNVSISYRRFIRSISDTQDILPKETVIEQGGMDNTISEIVKRVQNTVTASNVIKSSVEVEPGGATGSISDYAKRVDLTIDSDFKIKNGVKVVAGGADGTLSKKLDNVKPNGNFEGTAIEIDGNILYGNAAGGSLYATQGNEILSDVDADFSITPTRSAVVVEVTSSTQIDFYGISGTYPLGAQVDVLFLFPNNGSVRMIHNSNQVVDPMWLPDSANIIIDKEYSSITLRYYEAGLLIQNRWLLKSINV